MNRVGSTQFLPALLMRYARAGSKHSSRASDEDCDAGAADLSEQHMHICFCLDLTCWMYAARRAIGKGHHHPLCSDCQPTAVHPYHHVGRLLCQLGPCFYSCPFMSSSLVEGLVSWVVLVSCGSGASVWLCYIEGSHTAPPNGAHGNCCCSRLPSPCCQLTIGNAAVPLMR